MIANVACVLSSDCLENDGIMNESIASHVQTVQQEIIGNGNMNFNRGESHWQWIGHLPAAV